MGISAPRTERGGVSSVAGELTTGRRELRLPVRVVSDWHLGHPASRWQGLREVDRFLEGAGTFVMAGDGREELVDAWRDRADDLWDALKDRCRAAGCDFLALTGNHDPSASDDGWLFLEEGRILITHGDMIYDTSSPWSRELFARRKEVEGYLDGCRSESLEERWQAAREIGYMLRPDKKMAPGLMAYAKLALWPPERLLEIGKTWAGFAAEGGRFLSRFAPQSGEMVCGHFHRPGRFAVGERTVWNTGSMMKLSQWLVIDYDGERLAPVRI